MEKEIYHIFDKSFKKILTMSAGSVIRLINGLFDTDYPVTSTVTYNWTEFEDDRLRKTLADTILTINGTDRYHLEAQMYRDDDIVFRVFEYGFGHANRERVTEEGISYLKFPEPRIIYLYYEKQVPDQYTLALDFGSQGSFRYVVPTVKFLEISAEELNRKNMIILIPFYLLKLRRSIEKARTPKNLEALKNLILNDIIGSINQNLKAGNITPDDARRLKQLTHRLYRHLYAGYREMEVLNEMTDESLMLDIDLIEKEHEKQLREQEEGFQKQLEEQKEQFDRQKKQLEEQKKQFDRQKKQLTDLLADRDRELAALQKQLAQLQSR